MTVPALYKVSCMDPAAPMRVVTDENDSGSRSGRRFRVFFMIGVVSTLVDISLLWLYTECLGMWYLLSATASYCCSIVVSYGLNRNPTFHDERRHYLRQFFVFAIISASGLAINLFIMYIAVDELAIHYMLGKGVATGVSFFWNYFGQCRITFQVRNRMEE